MKRYAVTVAAAGLAVLAALAPTKADAFACGNCYNEATAIFQEAKRLIEFAKLLSEAKKSAEYEYRSWQALFEAKSFGSLMSSMDRLARTHYPDGRYVIGALRDGKSIIDGGDSLDRLLSRGTVSRLERTWGNAGRWYDSMEGQQRIVALGRDVSENAIARSQESIAALKDAEAMLARNKGVAEISAGLAALQLAGLNTQQNRMQLEAVRLRIETEALQRTVRREEEQRRGDLEHASGYAWAFDAVKRGRR